MLRLASLAPTIFLAIGLPAQASYTPFGTGCEGTVGFPMLSTAPGSIPRLGGTFTARLSNVPDSLAAVVFGFSDTEWGEVMLPASLDPLGLTGCTLYVSVKAALATAPSGGIGDVSVFIPDQLDLLGVEFFNQGAVVDFVNPAGLIVSNAAAGVIGPAALPASFDLTGTWDVTETVGLSCFGPVPDLDYEVVITQTGNEVTATFPDRVPETWTLSGASLEYLGNFTIPVEGTTTITGTSLVATDASHISGTVDWVWTEDGSFYCSGTNTVSAVKQD